MSAQKAVAPAQPDKRRVIAMVGVIAVLVAWLAHDQLATGGGAGGSAASAERASSVAASGTSLAPGAPRDLDARGLTNRYAPVLTRRPFTVLSFKPAPPPRTRRDPGPRNDPPPKNDFPPPPAELELLLTGTIGVGPGRVAYLEHRGSGRALTVREGDELGKTTVAKVETAALVLSEGARTQRLELGEVFKLPQDDERRLEPLRKGPPPSEPARPGAGGDPAAPAPSAEDRAALLERLRARRRQSMQPDKPAEKPTDKPERPTGEGDEPGDGPGSAPPGEPPPEAPSETPDDHEAPPPPGPEEPEQPNDEPSEISKGAD